MAWYEDTIAKLKTGNFSNIDINKLIEEIEGLAGRDRREFKSRLRVLLAHLLKRIYVNSPDDYRGWEITVRSQRQQLLDLLEQSPSLRNYFAEIFTKCWNDARTEVTEDYPQTEFPSEWTFSYEIDTLLNKKFW
ncbi:DUF29 domain-containing protein [Gloeocapsopsis crepidinum]|nr:DUF29 domain-containing protein [Gloeocapsopsis crepidinum]